jgi:tetratricopeptide (TPR) repeat protein
LKTRARTTTEICKVLVQAGRGLAAAHARGVVHRDFKPDNVLVDGSDRARVADFGLARAAPVPGDALAGAAPHATSLAGTPAYLAPELLYGSVPDPRSDQYAFGITAFEALYGAYPFEGKSSEAIWAAMADGKIRDVAKARVPQWLDRHVRRALAVKPEERWPSVAAFVDAIERGPRRRWPWVVGAAVLVNLALVAWLASRAQATCDARLIDRVWNAQARALDAISLQRAAPHSSATVRSALAAVDDWSAAWSLGAEAACHVDGSQRIARQSCLELGLAQLRATLAMWQAPDPDMADNSLRAITSLPGPETCGLHAPPPAHAQPATIDRLAQLQALESDGRLHDATPRIAPLLAETVADPVSHARVLQIAGRIERQLGDHAHARAHDVAAAREAAAHGDDDVTFRALLEQSRDLDEDGHASEALGLVDAAEAVALRAGLHREDAIAVARGAAYGMAGRVPEAIAEWRRGITILVPLATRDRGARLSLAAVYGSIGGALGKQMKEQEALEVMERGLAIELADLGPDHPEVAMSIADEAAVELTLERFDDAAAHYQRARQVLLEHHGAATEAVAACDLGLGNVARARGDLAGARRSYELARTELAAALSPTNPGLATIDENLAWCDRAEDNNQGAIAHFARAIALREAAHTTGTDLADDEVELGTVYFELENTAQARLHGERGLALHTDLQSSELNKVNAYLLMSELEAGAGRKAAAISYANKLLAAIGDDPRADQVALRKRELGRIAELSR